MNSVNWSYHIKRLARCTVDGLQPTSAIKHTHVYVGYFAIQSVELNRSLHSSL